MGPGAKNTSVVSPDTSFGFAITQLRELMNLAGIFLDQHCPIELSVIMEMLCIYAVHMWRLNTWNVTSAI